MISSLWIPYNHDHKGRSNVSQVDLKNDLEITRRCNFFYTFSFPVMKDEMLSMIHSSLHNSQQVESVMIGRCLFEVFFRNIVDSKLFFFRLFFGREKKWKNCHRPCQGWILLNVCTRECVHQGKKRTAHLAVSSHIEHGRPRILLCVPMM